MPTTNGSGKSSAAPIVVALLAGLVLGAVGGRMTAPSAPSAPSKDQGGYQQGYDAAKKELVDRGFVPPSMEVTSLNGTITALGASSFTLEASLSGFDPLSSDQPRSRQVTVDSATKLSMRVQKDEADFKKEQEAYSKALEKAEPGAMPVQPLPYTVETIAFKDLKVGDRVEVHAATDIKTAASFTATEVIVDQGSLGAAGPPPGFVPPEERTSTPTPAPAANEPHP